MTMMPTVQRLPIADISEPNRLRRVDPAWVELLAASIEQNGLRQAIIVRPDPDAPGRYLLIAGAHRLAAYRSLNIPEIEADVQSVEALGARLIEIDENLARRELTVQERATFLAERKRVHEAMHPETAHGGDRKSKKRQDEIKSPNLATCGFARFSETTAAAAGLSERAIRLLIQIAERLVPGAAALLAGTPAADNQSILLALTQMKAADQLRVARAFADGKSTIAAAKKDAGIVDDTPATDPVETQVQRALAWFAAWDGRTQQAFIAQIQKLRKAKAA